MADPRHAEVKIGVSTAEFLRGLQAAQKAAAAFGESFARLQETLRKVADRDLLQVLQRRHARLAGQVVCGVDTHAPEVFEFGRACPFCGAAV